MIKIFQQLSKKEIFLLIFSIFLILLHVWLDLELPQYMWKIAELVEGWWSKISEIIEQWEMMLLITLWSVFVTIILALISSKIAANFSAKLRLKIYEKVQWFSMENVKDFSIASLITRETNDVTQIQGAIVQWLQIFTKAPILATWALIRILDKNPIWSTATGIAIAILLVVATIALVLVIPRFKLIQKLVDNVNRVAREHINWIRVVRAYNAETYQERKFNEANEKLMKNNLFATRTLSLLMPSVDVIMNILTLSVYFLWGVIISQAALWDRLGLFSDMMVFSSYASQLIISFVMLVFVLVLIPWAAVSAKRIAEVLNTESWIIDWKYNNATKEKWKVEFKNVCFKYPDAEEEVISNITFTANKWETIALIGATGCWKSSIINLIPRFYDVTSWEVLVDWINVKDYSQKALRDKIWYIPQKSFLFRWDIKDNIFFFFYDSNRTQERLAEASKVSECDEFIKELEDWFEEYVALWWNNFSWGQKQRISIARAIARKPEILIFDDSFSALDYKTDLKVRSNLKSILSWCTIFIVAQRIWTIKHADKILVIDEWKCVGIWKHEELLENCEVYKEIALSQLSEEELKKH